MSLPSTQGKYWPAKPPQLTSTGLQRVIKPILWQSAARSEYWAFFLSWASQIQSSLGTVSANKTIGSVVLDIRTMSSLYEGETMASRNLSYFPEVNQATFLLLLERKVMVDCVCVGGGSICLCALAFPSSGRADIEAFQSDPR